MEKIIVETDKASKSPTSSQGVKKNSVIFTSQKAAIDPKDGKMVGIGDIRVQAERVIKNILAIVEAGGGTRKDIVKIVVYLKEKNDLQGLNEVYKRYFPDELPARSLLLSRFTNDDMLVEMDAVAIV